MNNQLLASCNRKPSILDGMDLIAAKTGKTGFRRVFRPVFDGEGDGGGAGGGDASGGGSEEKIELKVIADPKTGTKKFVMPDGSPVFTQAHLNAEIGNARKEAAKGKETLIGELTALRDRASTSEAVKAELEGQIQALKEQTMSETDKLKSAVKGWEGKFNTETKKLADERDNYQRLFTEKMISTEILAASNTHKAISSEVMLQLVGSQAQLRDVVDPDNGKPTGAKEVVVGYMDKDEEGKTVAKVANVDDYFKWMKGQVDRYGNLFQGNQSGGTGTSPSNTAVGKNGLPDFDKMTMAEYSKWADANPDKVAAIV